MMNPRIGAIVHFWPKQETGPTLTPQQEEREHHQHKTPPPTPADPKSASARDFRDKPTSNQTTDPHDLPEQMYDPLAAIIVGIWSDGSNGSAMEVNLTVFGSTGIPFPATHVPLLDDSSPPADEDPDNPDTPNQDPRPTGYYCQWPDDGYESQPGFIDDDTRGANAKLQTQKTVAEDQLEADKRAQSQPFTGAKGGPTTDDPKNTSKREYPKKDHPSKDD